MENNEVMAADPGYSVASDVCQYCKACLPCLICGNALGVDLAGLGALG